jgi:Cu(I)/Ag(I) efflux system protein CusF
MRTRTIAVALALAAGLAGAAVAQELMHGTLATVDEAGGKVGIRFGATVGGASGATAPPPFRLQRGVSLRGIKPGDRVEFTAERIDGVMTITRISNE